LDEKGSHDNPRRSGNLKGPSLALFSDLYELTMAQAYWQSGVTARATFSLYFRSYPPDRAYFVLAGIQDALEYLGGFHFSDADIELLYSRGQLAEEFIEFLRGLRFTGSVRAMSEGTIIFANEPVIEVTAPVIEAQIVETYLINQVNLQSILATKASRVVQAAAGKVVVDYSARRAHGIDAANKVARVSYMVGFSGTSNVMAGMLYGIPTFGTMAHSFVESFPSERESFRAYADSFPDTSTFLVDTYDTLEGIGSAVAVANEMRRRGHALRAIRLDSGDLLHLSVQARALLDEAGLTEVRVFASGGLDEFEVDSLVKAGAAIDGFGVGTRVGVSADAPWANCVYKLVEYDGRPTLKLSSGRQTAPGPKQVFRYHDAEGTFRHDIVGLADERAPDDGGQGLLGEVMSEGRPTQRPQSLQQLRERFAREFDRLPDVHKALRSPAMYGVSTSAKLERLRRAVSQEVRGKQGQS
jgi:nicotinate phosphoribosyltransferase